MGPNVYRLQWSAQLCAAAAMFASGLAALPSVSTLTGAPALLSTLFYGPLAELEECRASAITEQSRTACDSEAQGSMVDWLSGLLGG